MASNPILFLPAIFYVLFAALFNVLVFGEYVPPKDYFGTITKSMGWAYSTLFIWAVDLIPGLFSSIASGVTIKMVKEATGNGRATLDTGIRTLKNSWLGLILIELLVNAFIASSILLLALPFVSEVYLDVLGSFALALLLFVGVAIGLVKIYQKIGWKNIWSLAFLAGPSLVFEGLGTREAIRRGARIAGRMVESMKEPSSKKEFSDLLGNFILASMPIMLGRDLVRKHATNWVYLVTRPLFQAYMWALLAVFLLIIWEKFGKEKKRDSV